MQLVVNNTGAFVPERTVSMEKHELPLAWSSNEEALTSLIKACAQYYRKSKESGAKGWNAFDGYKIPPRYADRIADVLVDSGWRFAVLTGYKRRSDGSLGKNESGRHVLMWDYDRQCFVDTFNHKFVPHVMRDALNTIVAGGLSNHLLARLDHLMLSRLHQRYGDNLCCIDSLPPNLTYLLQRGRIRIFND